VAAAIIVVGTAALPERVGAGIQPSSGFDHGRVEGWRAAIDVGASRPLSGVGDGGYFEASRAEQGRSPTLYAHSLPLEAFAELGVPGLALALTILGGTAAVAWRARGTSAVLLLGPAALAFAAANLVDWSWHLAGSGAVWAVAVGAMIGAVEARRARCALAA
jgi:O-antigen ligase